MFRIIICSTEQYIMFHKLRRTQHQKLQKRQHRRTKHLKQRSMQRLKLSILQSENMESRSDFLQLLDSDVCVHIMNFLDDPVDLVRGSTVSRSWRQFVITNEFAKQACLKRIPGVTNIISTCIVDKNREEEIDYDMKDEWTTLERDQKVYASLLLAIRKAKVNDSLVTMHYEECASITDKYSKKCILNTMYDSVILNDGAPSYWSSKGQENPDVPETLIYMIFVSILLKQGEPIYSAKSVRFRVGHPKSPKEFIRESRKYNYNWPSDETIDDKFFWSYVSPAFPMAQENKRQLLFKLPEPVLCIDAYLQIEILGRVQKYAKDGLYYICVSFVQVFGRPLIESFNTERTKPDKKLILLHRPEGLEKALKSYNPSRTSSHEMGKWFDKQHEVEGRMKKLITQQEPNYPCFLDSDEELDRGFDL